MNYLKILLVSPLLLLISAGPNPVSLKNSSQKNILKNTVEFNEGLRISKFEVSIYQYKEFLNEIAQTENDDLMSKMAIDPLVWDEYSFSDSYRAYYHSHELYDNYPVVGISYDAATAFCDWMTEVHGKVQDKSGNWEQKYRFRLPTEAEWLQAARGPADKDYLYPGGYSYPRGNRGEFHFNHKLAEGDYAGYTSEDNDRMTWEGYVITSPIKSFYNKYVDLYNIAGNVAEMVAEEGIAKGGSWFHEAKECALTSKLEYDQPRCWLGFRYLIEEVQ